MTSVKCLSAGLLAIVMLPASAAAQAMPASGRHEMVTSRVSVSQPGQSTDSYALTRPAFSVGSHASPQNMPGGVCDQGDDPMIC